jgi:hypothetical protein
VRTTERNAKTHTVTGRFAMRSARSLTSLSCVLVAVLACANAPASAVGDANGAACPNEQLRREDGSTRLPECRAYELVSPANKNGAAIAMSQPEMTAPSGESVQYGSTGVFADAQGSPLGNDYVASRGASGWTTRPIEAPQLNAGVILVAPTQGISEDLGETLVASLMPLAPGAVGGQNNIYLHDLVSGQYALVATTSHNDAFAEFGSTIYATYIGSSADGSHTVFDYGIGLVPGAFEAEGAFAFLEGTNIYDWSNGQLHLVNYLPDGSVSHTAISPVASELTGENPHPVSSDGSKVFFDAAGNHGNGGALYVREDDSRTVLISTSQRAGATGEPAEGLFVGASADGSKAYFTSSANLTEGPETTGAKLYRYDLSSGQLADLTVSSEPGVPAEVSHVIQVSEDGSFVYFTAAGALAPGATVAPPGLSNVYVWHEGTGIKLIAQANAGGQVSPNGLHFAFSSSTPLTADRCSGCQMLYEYDYETGQIHCASCSPSTGMPVASLEVGGIPYGTGLDSHHPGYVTNNGMVIFGSREALVPQDTNGVSDVYGWLEGRLSLLSPGTGSQEAQFADTSRDGRNVFFKTGQKLVGQDIDENVDLYDARIDGGFPGLPAANPCTGTGCQGVPSAPPIFATPPSVTFEGVGNFEGSSQSAGVEPKALTRAQKLSAALKVCHKRKPAKRRAACEARARKQYGKASRVKPSRTATKSNGRSK